MANSRVRRGGDSEALAAAYLREHGWKDAHSTHRSMPGKDVHGVPGHSIEVKARFAFDPMEWLRQSRKSAKDGERPCVIVRMRGQGPADVGEWYVFRRLADDELSQGPERMSEEEAAA